MQCKGIMTSGPIRLSLFRLLGLLALVIGMPGLVHRSQVVCIAQFGQYSQVCAISTSKSCQI